MELKDSLPRLPKPAADSCFLSHDSLPPHSVSPKSILVCSSRLYTRLLSVLIVQASPVKFYMHFLLFLKT